MVHYTSMAVFENDIAPQLRFNQDYPTVVDQCIPVDNASLGEYMTIDLQFDRAG